MFETVLIANRGEIAVRIIRTLHRLGVRSVAVHTDADARAPHVQGADLAVRIAGYLQIDELLRAARETGAQAVHPGYGFLAESTAFADACARAELVFVGPPASAIEAMGDKIRAKQAVAAAGVPVVPGRDEVGLSDDEVIAAAAEIGLPVLIKPSAGGGGKGMRLVRDPAELQAAVAAARREARAAFGDDTLLVERFVDNPRHLEIQVFADSHGNVVHLGERECSLQRRHQKIIEEAPSPLTAEHDHRGAGGAGPGGERDHHEAGPALRERMGADAVQVAKAVGYVGAGTVEYIVSADRPGEYFFMEMNTRLQVEHPVTELVCAVSGGGAGVSAPPGVGAGAGFSRTAGLDLVELQLRVAAGEPLPFGQGDIGLDGHAVEARIYAEDPARGFLPTGGTVLALTEPTGPGVRVDSGLRAGTHVGGAYDPMLAKVIAWGPDRATALRRLDRALASCTLLGVPTNIAFLRSLLAHPQVAAGRLDTGLVERALPELTVPDLPAEVLAAAALERMLALRTATVGGAMTDPWDIPDGWRLGEPAWTPWIISAAGHDPVEVRVRGLPEAAEVAIGDRPPVPCTATWATGPFVSAPDGGADPGGRRGGGTGRGGTTPGTGTGAEVAELLVGHGGRTTRFSVARSGDICWLGRGGRTWALTEHVRAEAGGAASGQAGGVVRSPMPGTVLSVHVTEGEQVDEGRALVIVEAMKMEHTVTAPFTGVVTRLAARPGEQVALDQPLAEIAPSGE